ncbi:hypothetical protein FM113_07935 [Leucobacter sp. 7(1)]|nr:hypothetical protein FM113_07935 [Leucobacter sp. 7(1)]
MAQRIKGTEKETWTEKLPADRTRTGVLPETRKLRAVSRDLLVPG